MSKAQAKSLRSERFAVRMMPGFLLGKNIYIIIIIKKEERGIKEGIPMSWRMTMKAGKNSEKEERRTGRGGAERNSIKIVLFGEMDSKENIKQ